MQPGPDPTEDSSNRNQQPCDQPERLIRKSEGHYQQACRNNNESHGPNPLRSDLRN